MKKLLNQCKRALIITAAVGLFASGLALVVTNRTSAAQMTARSLTISTAVTSTSANYTFGFKLGTAGQVQGLKFQFCTTALSTCTAPTGLTVASRTFGSQTGWTGATNFAISTTNTNDCDGTSASIICLNRTDATSENTTGAKTVVVNAVTNPSGASCASSNPNCTFFARMTTYTTSTFTAGSITDTGTIASSTTQTLTISAAIQEVLNFCVGSTSIDNATSTTGADCSAISGTTVGLGILDSTKINASPVSSNSGNSLNGVAMLRTNANGGATVTYRAIQQSGTNHQGGLRVVGATCNAGNVNSDQCIDSKGTTQGALTAGTESFGMTIAAINCGSTTAYTCTFSSGTYNLTRNAQYDGTGANTYPTDADVINGPSNAGYAWREDGNVDTIASSTGAVDDEAMILKFAATPNAVTPTGSYQAQGDFIVVATF